MRKVLAIAVFAALALALMANMAAAAPVTGAVWTTDDTCSAVNKNIYHDKCDVYLNGGPQGGGPGLPDGMYYYQVTSPNGDTLLSTEPIADRIVEVVDGRFADCVLLCPFSDTPNPGAEYKVWATNVLDYDDTEIAGSFGFIPSQSKTDNFKIKGGETPPTFGSIGGFKYYDSDLDGVMGPAETPIPGWLIELYDEDGDLHSSMYTDPYGAFRLDGLAPGTYTVNEVMPLGNWLQTGPKDTPEGEDLDFSPLVVSTAKDGIYTIELLQQNGVVGVALGVNFGNICYIDPSGGHTLGYWSNKNGQKVLSNNDADWRTALNALCLKDGAGNDYDVPAGAFDPAYTDFRNWLLGANAVDMSYMLSAQLAAAKLNTLYKDLDENAHILLTPSLANCYGSPTAYVGQAIAQANAALCNDASRLAQECFKDILDGINNNMFPFISSEPCDVVYPVED